MIDISDGLSTDLSRICEERWRRAEVWQDGSSRASVGRPPAKSNLEPALHGGEDYDCSLRRPAGSWQNRWSDVTPIGRITRKKKVMLADSCGSREELRPPKVGNTSAIDYGLVVTG